MPSASALEAKHRSIGLGVEDRGPLLECIRAASAPMELASLLYIDAASYGFVPKSAHGRLPRVQIATIDDLLSGRRPQMPPLPVPKDAPRTGPRRARDKEQLELLLPFAGTGALTAPDGSMIDPRFLQFSNG